MKLSCDLENRSRSPSQHKVWIKAWQKLPHLPFFSKHGHVDFVCFVVFCFLILSSSQTIISGYGAFFVKLSTLCALCCSCFSFNGATLKQYSVLYSIKKKKRLKVQTWFHHCLYYHLHGCVFTHEGSHAVKRSCLKRTWENAIINFFLGCKETR